MLVIMRKVGETFRIGEDVVLTVSAVKGEAVKLGVDAPKDVSVHRSEIYQRIAEDSDSREIKNA